MDDYTALAQRISVSVREVRGCFILSREGLVLGAYPDEDESLAKAAWLRFVALGEPEKSFVEFNDQTWAYVRRGPYAAFAVADQDVRPGILVDQLDQALMTAEEQRTRRDSLKVPDAPSAPSGKPRTSMHPGAGKEKPVEVTADVASAPAPSSKTVSEEDRRKWARGSAKTAGSSSSADGQTADTSPTDETAENRPPLGPAAPGTDTEAPRPSEESTALRKEPQRLAGDPGASGEEETEVDRVLLAKEFSGLLQMDSGDDEGSS